MINWPTVASLATAAGTLVLAVATFSSVRSANRAARAAERSLLVGLRPVLMPSHLQDPAEKISFVDGHWVKMDGGHAVAEIGADAIYLAISVRNAGNGIAVLHGWSFFPERRVDLDHLPPGDFRRLSRDIYVPAASVGFWQGTFRDVSDPAFATAKAAIEGGATLTVDVLYGDHEGGQRMISRFALVPITNGGWLAAVSHHWNLDRPDPRR